MIKTKRTYDKPQEEDFRILVDRICPRGIKITIDVQMDLWQKYISPSILLGKWFKHDDESKWNEFKKNRYYQQLQDKE